MNWNRWLAALLVMLALAGCAQRTTGQAGAPYAPYSPENTGDKARARRRGWRRYVAGEALCDSGALPRVRNPGMRRGQAAK